MPCTKLSDVTKQYLSRYYDILDEMIRNMNGAEQSGSVSRNFIAQMIPHHYAAVEMSRNILRYTTLLPLQNIAQEIIDEQTRGIAEMRDIANICGAAANTPEELRLYQLRFRQVSERMFARMRSAAVDNDINADFMREMIPHHEGAIHMSKNALQYPLCPELVPILREIISSQEKGVLEMRRLLKCSAK